MQFQALITVLFASAALASSGPPARSGPGNSRGRRDLTPGGSLLPRAWLSSLGLSAAEADVTKRDIAPETDFEVVKREADPEADPEAIEINES
ncbi:uncharacterized protein CTRU02_207505 [Colletotrichum truncatum]|uniref:Uncharacterized protein n=1 Tax=Colletotrichum truncatum TaxID=5467 RepID=A0ACC3Z107_COLTU|nr:uncharacterized protein CTRU02_00863 [Colletotrichum truncatum]KAF6800458.1 hypothetical protein CTRU02_00863 [Colletotrichum truncatum]